ncbi:MAG: ABC transporter permease [Thermoflexales bacterium]|nr:ABC transporter permease [Thermoflexales bacterium]MCS7325543.1 ABC transporter permease [Thermoflexales bacterium]MDW8053765.1 ABC transporter permease [Anaerolineae bacterium]MDW8293611.1 ABC transporter permease [Anaerolineae bacterium]
MSTDTSVIFLGERESARPRVREAARRPSLSRFALTTIALLTFAFLYVPILVLIAFSFNSARTGAAWQGFTLQWYARLFNNPRILDAALNSLIVAVVATIGAVVLGTLMAMAMERYRFRFQAFWDSLLYMPVIIPEIVMGISLLLFFASIRLERGLLTLIIAHIAFCMPFVYLTMRARLADFDRSLEEAAQDLGADEWTTFRRITLPLLMPGIISSALLAFTLSLDDFVISFFVTGVGSQTLPVYIWGQIRRGITPEINAVSTLMLILSFVLVTLSHAMQQRTGAR